MGAAVGGSPQRAFPATVVSSSSKVQYWPPPTPDGVGFPGEDIQVARFLGPQGHFRVGRQRLPSGYNLGRAFQLIQGGASDLKE